MTLSSLSMIGGLCLSSSVLFVLEVSATAGIPSFLGTPKERSMLQIQNEAAKFELAARSHRNLQWLIDYTPGADPDATCKAFQEAAPNYQCSCDLQPDKSVGLKCLEKEPTCNTDSSLCFKQNINVGLTTDQVIKDLETCTVYGPVNFTRFEGSSTKLANYTQITPCVKVVPQSLGDFSKLESCTATVNGQECHKCEICTDNEPNLGITMDCCNTNPNGEPLKVECGLMGGGGAFAPIFDTYEEGEEEQCSGAFGLVINGIFGSLVLPVFAAASIPLF